MPKKSKRYKKKSLRGTRRIIKRRYNKGGNGENVRCCMCETYAKKENTLVPRRCLTAHGKAAHRICQDCWWDPISGFAREDAPHDCPGCVKDMPLTDYKKEPPILVDLTED
jgi:hypothetical protein